MGPECREMASRVLIDSEGSESIEKMVEVERQV